MIGHVNLGSYAPTPNVINPTPVTGIARMGLAPSVATAPMERAKASGCRRRRMGKAGTRCFCNNKLVKSGRCK